MSGAAIDFYFDFSSPYGYLAAQRIEALAGGHGADVRWRPFLLGALFELTGNRPLLEQPLKGDYARHDLFRSARRIGVPFTLPAPFPFAAVALSRAFYWLHDQDPDAAKGFARRALDASYGEGRDLSKLPAVLDLLQAAGHDRAAAEQALTDPAVKARLRQEVDAAIASGVFGSPYIVAGGEPFWGFDRLPDIAAWLDRGGW